MPPQTSPDKALAAILPSIQAGQAYEAHQKARTFGSRYLKSQAYDSAITVLFTSARELLKAGHAGSGSDLALFLIDVYTAKKQSIDAAARDNITQLIALTGPIGVWRKTIIDKAVAWSAETGPTPLGDPQLQQYVGTLLYKEGQFQQAETHFLAAGSRDGARSFAEMMVAWLPVNGDPGAFAARGVIPYLLLQNILAARTFLETFISQARRKIPSLITSSTPLTLPSINSASFKTEDELFVTSNRTLNFLQLAIRACQRGNGETSENEQEARKVWVRLVQQYRTGSNSIVSGAAMSQACSTLGNAYFNIPLPRAPGNPLQDMMASLFGGSPGSGSTGGPKRVRAPDRLD